MSRSEWSARLEQVCDKIRSQTLDQTRYLTLALQRGNEATSLSPIDTLKLVADTYIELSGDPTGLMTNYRNELVADSKKAAAQVLIKLSDPSFDVDW